MRNIATSFIADEVGATAIEYAMIASLISVVIVGTLSIINQDMVRIFNYIGDNISPVLPSGGHGGE